MRFVGVLPGGCRMATPSTPEYLAITWCGFGTEPAFNDISLDGPREHQRIREETRRRQPSPTGEHEFISYKCGKRRG